MKDLILPQVFWSPYLSNQSDCDCGACAITLPTIKIKPKINHGHWVWNENLDFYPLTSDFDIAFCSNGRYPVIALNKQTRNILSSFSNPRSITSNFELDLAKLGLLQREGDKFSPIDYSYGYLTKCELSQQEIITAWMHVTNACNLRCSYCYVDKTDEEMDEVTGLAAVEALFNTAEQHGFKAAKLKYAGGEATLNFSLIKTLHNYAVALASQSGIELQEVLLSNGVALTSAMLDFMRKSSIRLMISLDGLGTTHDEVRVFRNGHGSFAQVEKGIERAIRHSVPPDLSITVTARNANGLAEVVAYALDHDLRFNLNFYRDNDFAKNRAMLQAEDEQLIAGVQAALAEIEARLPERSFIGGLLDRSSFAGPHAHACGADHNYMVIDQRGRIARCHMEIERPVTDIFADDPLADIKADTSGFKNLSVDEKEGCRDCTWRYWCAGGCPLLTHRVTGRNDVKSPYCNVYQAIFPELLRLEGLRLLKWHGQQVA